MGRNEMFSGLRCYTVEAQPLLGSSLMIRRFFLVCVSVFFALAVPGFASEYDPRSVLQKAEKHRDLILTDSKRKRDIPVRIYLPFQKTPQPVILVSHGLGGTRETHGYLGEHWSQRGYVVVMLQHPGSDDSVWKNTPLLKRREAMAAAASGENLLLRIGDVSAVLDQLQVWVKDSNHFLHKRIDMSKVGMSGHSFGAVTTQAVSGQKFGVGNGATDLRIKAAMPMSPSMPRDGGDAKRAFGDVKIPWLLMTGTKDDSPIGNITADSRLKVFPGLPAGDKYELVLFDALHSAFTDRVLEGGANKRNPNHHKAIQAISTAFWDAYLMDNADAKKWLKSPKLVQAVLEKNDRWQAK
jgi:predicted dienelactone hydrolase